MIADNSAHRLVRTARIVEGFNGLAFDGYGGAIVSENRAAELRRDLQDMLKDDRAEYGYDIDRTLSLALEVAQIMHCLSTPERRRYFQRLLSQV